MVLLTFLSIWYPNSHRLPIFQTIDALPVPHTMWYDRSKIQFEPLSADGYVSYFIAGWQGWLRYRDWVQILVSPSSSRFDELGSSREM